MNLLQRASSIFSLNPTEKPEIMLNFFPVIYDKYISIINLKNEYCFFDNVLHFLSYDLNKNKIGIVHLICSDQDKLLNNCVHIKAPSISQLNFILKKSSLHISNDFFSNLTCNILKTKNIKLSGNLFEKKIDINYPSEFSYRETIFPISEKNIEDINCIPPEKIYTKCCEFLGISPSFKFETIFSGEFYKYKSTCDILEIKNFKNFDFSKFETLNLRLDLLENKSVEYYKDFISNIRHPNIKLHLNNKITQKDLSFCEENCLKLSFNYNHKSELSDIFLYKDYPFLFEINCCNEISFKKILKTKEFDLVFFPNKLFEEKIKEISDISTYQSIKFSSSKSIFNNGVVYNSINSALSNSHCDSFYTNLEIIKKQNIEDFRFMTLILTK